ncbi:AraC family transcriptional regulator [Paenibacillus sp. NPDC056579]|uniref:AraC family transcriptional regulator n=1 Tax=Paenibacillus sp. NPDC056579 TaxID=3345871 RepID=UPI0036838828
MNQSTNLVHHLGQLSRLLPVVHFAEYSRRGMYSWGWRTIPDCQLLYVLSGQMELQLGGRTYILLPGDCAYYGPDSPHKLVSKSPDTSFCSIHFDWHRQTMTPAHPILGIRVYDNDEPAAEPIAYTVDVVERGSVPLPHVSRASSLESLFIPIVKEYREQEPGFELQLRAHLTTLLIAFARLQLARIPSERGPITPALEAIASAPERSWSVAELASLCGYHPVYFSEVFRNLIGQTPKTYLMLARTQKAKQLLLSGAKITDIVDRLGYGSIHYFSRNFKERTGLSPSQYRIYGQSEADEKAVRE